MSRIGRGLGSSNALGEATWTELERGLGDGAGVGDGDGDGDGGGDDSGGDDARTVAPVLVVPIGSCEQHGPHLPLDTDTRIATAVAHGLAAERPRLLVAPAQAITASGEHSGFPGTLSIGTDVMQAVLIELVRSADWSAGVVLVNGHGGNLGAVEAAVELLMREGRRVFAWWPKVSGGDAHAGRTETSLMLAIAPTLVRIAAAKPGNTEPLRTLMPAMAGGGIAAVSPNGVLGDPTGASAGEGRSLLAALIADLSRGVDEWLA
ncbi:MAG: mycofactocin biosynthesis peptidyl-dipeptidase MftE [Ilumatobacteraceae bacterium]